MPSTTPRPSPTPAPTHPSAGSPAIPTGQVAAGGRAQLRAGALHLVRGGRDVLGGASLTVTPSSRWGVVGENGRGKSTLLHVLAGRLIPDSGHVQRIGSLGLAEQEMDAGAYTLVGDIVDAELADARAAVAAVEAAADCLADDRPGAADAYAEALQRAEALQAWDADRRVDRALEVLGAVTDRDRPVTRLSVGQRYRVRLACLLGARPDFLLLDEPTNHLDGSGLDFLTDALRTWPGGVVLVSHDRALLADVATDILDLDPSVDGAPAAYGDGYAGYRRGREAAVRRWVQVFEREQAEHARLGEDLARAQDRLRTGWRPDKGTGKHQRATRAAGVAQSVRRRREALTEHAIATPEPPLRLAMPRLATRPGAPLLRAASVAVPGRLAGPVDVDLDGGDRLLVTGANGSGKSTLLALLAGALDPAGGAVRVSEGVRVGLLAQETAPLPGRVTAAETYRERVGRLVVDDVIDDDDAPSLTALGLLDAATARRAVGTLSMGQRRRLDLALLLAGRPHVLLLDEPTNHLSIALVDELTEALRRTEAAVVVATHDRQLRRDLAAWPVLDLGGGAGDDDVCGGRRGGNQAGSAPRASRAARSKEQP